MTDNRDVLLGICAILRDLAESIEDGTVELGWLRNRIEKIEQEIWKF